MQPSKVSGRLQSSLSDGIQELISSPRLARELGPAFSPMLEASAAHLVMLHEQHLVDRDATIALADALLKMKEEGSEAIVVDPALEDAYFNIEARIVHHAGNAGGKLHLGRSRNDLGATVDRMRTRKLVLRLACHISELMRELVAQGERYKETIMTGYTHLQVAQPITFGYYLLGIASALQRDLYRISSAWDRINLSPMGAGALAGTPVPVDRPRVAELLGFDGPVNHCLDAVASRDFAIEVLVGLLGATTVISRFAADLQTWATPEFSLIDFPDSVAGTSSIMPQKKNLALLEHIKAKPAHVLSAVVSASSAVKSVYFTNTMDGNRESMRLFWEAAEEGIIGVRLANIAASTVVPLCDNMKRAAEQNYSTVTDLADYLATKEGYSFRQAHHIVGAVVHNALAKGLTCEDVDVAMVRMAAGTITDRVPQLDEKQLRTALDPDSSVRSRNVLGGPAPEQSTDTARQLTLVLNNAENWASQKRQSLEISQQKLWDMVVELSSGVRTS